MSEETGPGAETPANGNAGAQEPTAAAPQPAIEKQRHGCLTAWLILMLIANSVFALVYIFGAQALKLRAAMPDWAFPVLALGSLVNAACAVALFWWKKWGFYAFCVTSVIALGVNLSTGMSVSQIIVGLLGVLFLYGVLHIGGARKGWNQLE
ncbi:MAG: hypothetical protein A3J79_12200 [Elusimicrobia bacterium RIFOXYB2_FULL_62_6]|nr:MAG: hypothetical protein A3J79_12200 [Elusimicrobia bacterium RIFOXYB2_FULL_62_6]